MPTRILHVIPSLEWGHAAKQLLLLLRHLPRENFTSPSAPFERGEFWKRKLPAISCATVTTTVAKATCGRCDGYVVRFNASARGLSTPGDARPSGACGFPRPRATSSS